MAEAGLEKWFAAPYEKERPFLEQIPREARDYFILKSQIREYDKGDMIFPGESDGEYFYVLQTGRLQVCGDKVNGKYTEVAILEKGACFGEMSIMTENLTSNAIIALTDATVFAMTREDFTHFITANPAILILLYKILADRLRAKNKAYSGMSGTSLMGSFRVLAFVDIAQAFEKERTSGTLHITRDQLEGVIAFKDGQLIFALAGKKSGPEALEDILSWEDALFKFDGHSLPKTSNIAGGSTTGMILDALRNLDEKSAR